MRYFEIYKTGGFAPGPPFVWAAPVEPGRVQTFKLRGLRPAVPHYGFKRSRAPMPVFAPDEELLALK